MGDWGKLMGVFRYPLEAAPALLNHSGRGAIVPQQFQGCKGEKMNSSEFNKICGVLLTVALVVALSNFIGNEIFPKHPAKVQAYVIAGTDAGSEEAPGTDAATAEAPLGVAALLAAADPAAGAKGVKKCTACHSLDKGGKHKIGPNLWDLIDRPIASAAGYGYSDALKAKSGEAWSYENLDAFLTKPKDWAPGTKMSFAGLKKPGKRADLIAHLRSLSDSPAALPE
jgi:cytochrome c